MLMHTARLTHSKTSTAHFAHILQTAQPVRKLIVVLLFGLKFPVQVTLRSLQLILPPSAVDRDREQCLAISEWTHLRLTLPVMAALALVSETENEAARGCKPSGPTCPCPCPCLKTETEAEKNQRD